jgi:YARHG domain
VTRLAAIFGTSLVAGLVATTSFALSQNLYRLSCSELWYERNNIFKDAGYCFSRLHAPFGLSATLDALMTANPMCPYPIGIGNVSMRYSASSARKVARASISTSNSASNPSAT